MAPKGIVFGVEAKPRVPLAVDDGGKAAIAADAGVSKMTVSRVLRGGEGFSDETRERVMRVAAELGLVGVLALEMFLLPGGALLTAEADVAAEVVGILAAQPCDVKFLGERARFMEMVANLIAHSVNMLRVLERKQQELVSERDYLKETLVKNYRFENIIGHSEPMLKLFDIIRQVAKWQTTVLIRGESGTGKELIAQAIHYNSPRREKRFIAINCGALPENLEALDAPQGYRDLVARINSIARR